MVLPTALMEAFRRNLGFYSCTVSSFEQYTLARFLSRGYFEKHINRMRKYYKTRRNQVVSALNSCIYADKLTILEEDAGLHFILKVDTAMTDEELVDSCGKWGIKIRALSSYYHSAVPAELRHHLVVNYSGIREDTLENLLSQIHL